MKNEKIILDIDMTYYDIGCAILVEGQSVGNLCREFLETPDWKICGGRGKKYLHELLKKKLQKEDEYFLEHIDEAITTNDRWMSFMEDCVMFSALDHVITARPIRLIHPSSYGRHQHSDMTSPRGKHSLVEGFN